MTHPSIEAIARCRAWTSSGDFSGPEDVAELLAAYDEMRDAVDEVHEKLALFIAMSNGRSPSRVGQLKDFQGLLKMHGLVPLPKDPQP